MALKCLWNLADLPNARREMLEADDYAAFIFTIDGDHIEALEYLWGVAEELQDVQRAMLKYDDYLAFRLAALGVYIRILNFL
ncbi:MAG: hypothetical protein ACR5KX_06380 [Wolbachia sp.]